jgi:hypothetical protein
VFDNSPFRSREKDRRKVRLFVADGPTIEGVEAGRTRHDYILWAPRVLSGDADNAHTDLTGHVEVERAKVQYKQVVYD